MEIQNSSHFLQNYRGKREEKTYSSVFSPLIPSLFVLWARAICGCSLTLLRKLFKKSIFLELNALGDAVHNLNFIQRLTRFIVRDVLSCGTFMVSCTRQGSRYEDTF